MRADRLVAILLMLQTRGQVTAADVAAELEISERTARRDLDSLGVAGLPVYSVQGRNGGWRLLGDGRTDLTGLTSAETQALFLLAGPWPRRQSCEPRCASWFGPCRSRSASGQKQRRPQWSTTQLAGAVRGWSDRHPCISTLCRQR